MLPVIIVAVTGLLYSCSSFKSTSLHRDALLQQFVLIDVKQSKYVCYWWPTCCCPSLHL